MVAMRMLLALVLLISAVLVRGQGLPDDETCDAGQGSTDICAVGNRFGGVCVHGNAPNFREKTRCCPGGQQCDSPLNIYDCPTRFCVVIDGSYRVTRGRFTSVTAALCLWIDITHVDPNAVTWAYVFSSAANSSIDFVPFQSAEQLKHPTISIAAGPPFTHFGLEKCLDFMENAGLDGFVGMVILITGGNSNEPDQTRAQIERGWAIRVQTFIITIGHPDDYVDIDEYLDIVGPDWTIPVAGFGDFASQAISIFDNIPGCAVCGDRFVDVDQCEECDDGNRVNGDGCDRDCITEAVAPKQCDAYTCETVKYKAQLLPNVCRIGERCKDEFSKCDMRPFKKIKDFTLPRSCKKWLRCQTKWTDFEQGGAVVGELGTGCQCELLPKSERYGFRDGDDFTPEPAGSIPAATCAQHSVDLFRMSNTAVMIVESPNLADITWGFISGKTTPTITKLDDRRMTRIEGMKKNGEYVFSMTISSLWSSNSVPTLCFRHSVFRFTR